jgi:signal transduction histidine kinase
LDRYGKKGNGIGLSTVKKLVTKLGGEIRVSSELGKGTTIEFTIRKSAKPSEMDQTFKN